MSTITTPVSMLTGSGSGKVLAIGVLGLILTLMLASRSDPTARKQTV